MGQNKVSLTLWGIVAILILSILIIFGNGIFSSSWKYEFDVRPMDVITLCVTSLITIFAAWYITKYLNEDRYAKELVIEDLKQIESTVGDIIDLSGESSNVSANTLSRINKLHLLIERLGKTCNINGKKVNITPIQNKFYLFYGFATDYSESGLDLPSIQLFGDNLIIEIRTMIGKINTL